jgi:hypothetical protein
VHAHRAALCRVRLLMGWVVRVAGVTRYHHSAAYHAAVGACKRSSLPHMYVYLYHITCAPVDAPTACQVWYTRQICAGLPM